MTLGKNIVMCLVAFNVSTTAFGMENRQEESMMPRFLVNVVIAGISAYGLSKFLPQALTQPTPINVGVTSVAALGIYNAVPAAYEQGKEIFEFDEDTPIDKKIKSTGGIAAGFGKMSAGIVVGTLAYQSLTLSNLNNTLTLKNYAQAVIATKLVVDGIKDLQWAYKLD